MVSTHLPLRALTKRAHEGEASLCFCVVRARQIDVNEVFTGKAEEQLSKADFEALLTTKK
jgi:hypothetical protein